MSTVVLPAVVVALAHQRLRDLVEALGRRQAADRQPVETQVLTLAQAALGMLEAGERLALPATSRLAPGPARAAIAGTLGFGLADQADVFGGNGPWRGTALRHGTPDPDLGRVVVPTTQFAIRVGERSKAIADPKAKAATKAFALGMLGTVASDVVLNPVFRGLQARRTTQDWQPGLPGPEHDAAVRRAVRLLTGTRDATWTSWWPAASEVPDDVLRAWLAAVAEVYQLDTARPKGFATFESSFVSTGPLDLERAKRAYEQSRRSTTSGWSAWGWFFSIAPFFAMPAVATLLARDLRRGKAFFTGGSVDEEAIYEVLTLGTALGGVVPAVWSMGLWTQVPEHASVFFQSLALLVVRLVAGLGFAFTADDDDRSEEFRWGLIAGPQLAASAYALIGWIVSRRQDRRGNRFVFGLNTTPILAGLVTLGFAALASVLGDDDVWWLLFVLISLGGTIGGALAFALSLAGRSPLSFFHEGAPPSLIAGAGAAADPGITEPAAPALVFDDSTLWTDKPTPTLADLAYPSGTRPVVRVWFEGAGELRIGHDGHAVVLQPGAGGPVTVAVPPQGHTAAELAAALLAAGVNGLQAEAIDTDPAHVYVLPHPATLADPGDDQATRALHDQHAADLAKVGGSRSTAHILRHAPRVEQATPYSLSGPSGSPMDRVHIVPVTTLGGAEATALGTAADLAALLMLGAAPSLAEPALAAPLHPVYQVFRQWNLDERRVNEWRMLVSGDAVSEKGGNPASHDPGMRPLSPGDAFAPSPAAALGETIANGLGWVRAFRAWARVAGDTQAATNGRNAESYSPVLRRADGTRTAATNQELTAAVRFLLDLP